MTNRLMVSVAAIALLAGAGFAQAQGTGGAGGAGGQSGGAAAQGGASGGAAGGAMSQPGGAMNRDSASPSTGGSSDMRSSQSGQKSGAETKGQHAEDGMKGPNSKSTASDNDKSGTKNMKAEGREGRDNNMKAEGRDSKTGTNTNAETKTGTGTNTNTNAETKTGGDRSQVTTGQAGAGAKLSTEQRTKITSVIRSPRVEPVTNVNFNISVGTRVPREVHFHPLPAEVVTVYPEWRGYDFILVREQIIVIDPRSYEIVAVLDT